MDYRFTLTYNGNDTILENDPQGITEIESSLERDFDNHGVFYRFTDGDLRIDFSGEGRDVFIQARDEQGLDALVTFTMEKRNDQYSEYIELYSGDAIMSNLTLDQDYAKVDFRESNLMTNVHDNLSTKVNFDSTEDIYGGAVTPLTAESITLPGRNLGAESGAQMNAANLVNPDSVFEFTRNNVSGATTVNPNSLISTIKNEILNPNGKRGFNNDNLPPNPLTIGQFGGQFYFSPLFENYTIRIEVDFVFDTTLVGTQPAGTIDIDLERVEDEGLSSEATTTFTIRSYNPAVEGAITNETVSYANAFTIDSEKTTPTLFRFNIVDNMATGGGGAVSMAMDFDSFTMNASLITEGIPESTADMHKLFDAVDKNIEYITGQSSVLKSDFFDSSGNGEFFYETNGYKIRSQDYPIIGTLQNRLDSIRAIFATGYGFESDAGYNIDAIRLEPFEYFYADAELMVLNDIENESYEEEFYDPLMFNKIDIGYEKFADDEKLPSTQDDVNTQAQYITPVERLENSYVQISKYIGSDILGEIQRRIQFQTTTESGKNDDDLFVFDVDNSSSEPRDDTDIDIDNVPNSDSGYNFRINPRFNLWNHSLLVNSSVYRKALSDEYRNQFWQTNNGQSRAINYDAAASDSLASIGDSNRNASESLEFDDSFNIGRYGGGLRLFDPIKIKFKTAITQDQSQTLIFAHRNALPSNNYGYITITNPDGETVSGWLLKLNYNPIDEIGTFELIKRADNYGN